MTDDCPAPRRRCAETTRNDLREAAACRFAQQSYEAVSLRDVARDVGVDVALVSRYFGSKEELFRDVVECTMNPLPVSGPAESLPEQLASLVLDKPASENKERSLLLLLHAAASPKARAILDEIDAGMRRPLMDAIGGEDAELRSAMAASFLVGLAVMRRIMAPGALQEAPPEVLRPMLVRIFREALKPTA
jgi:AcrR family transcriptional regulator